MGTIDPCSEQTRVELLRDIDDWIAAPNANRVYWLKERAGFGKTAIALSVAERAAKRGQLAASFFFSYQVPDLDNASLFFPTIAFQFAHFDNHRYRQLFAESVRDSPDASAAKLKSQVEVLFSKPLGRVEPTSQPLLIVIDAFDECDQAQAEELIGILIKASQALPLPLRLFLTSRPEHHLITAFERVEISPRSIADTSKADVEIYLRQELPDIPRRLGIRDMSSDWITETEIATIVRQAGGLFVYASVVVRFIGYRAALNPRKRLEILLRDDPVQSTAYQPYAPLDRLYKRVLDVATDGQRDLVEDVLVVLGGWTIIEEKVYMTPALLAPLIGLEISDVRRTLIKLQSVVVYPDSDDGTVTFHHASFKDFLLNPSRSGPEYFLDPHVYHHRLALQSMQMIVQSPHGKKVQAKMASESYVFQAEHDEPDFPGKLRYALTYVFLHTTKSLKDATLKNALDDFSQQGSLWWLEYDLPIKGNLYRILQDPATVYTWRASDVQKLEFHNHITKNYLSIRSMREMLPVASSF